MSGANNRTLNVDSLFVRNIYFKDYANNPIPANQLLVSRGDGGTYFGNLPYSTNSTFYQAINEVDAPTADGGTYRLVASTSYNTLLLEPGAGMQFYSNSQTGGLIVYNTGPEQIVAGGQSLPFSTLTDELVGGRTLFFQGKNDINVYISGTTVVFESISNSNLSTIVQLQSTTIGLEQEFSTTNGYLNSSINTINVLFYSTNLYYLTSTLNAQYALIGGLSTYFLVPNQINISTVSTTNLTINQNVIRDIALNNSIYDPCAVYANNTVISTNTDFLTFTDQFTNVTFAIDKEYLFASSTLKYGPSTTTVTKGQQVQLGWFPGISTQGSNTQSLRSQFVPVVQQMQVIEYIVSTNNVSTIGNYYLQNIGKFDKICSPSNLILAANNVYTSSIYLSTINGISVLANGTNYGDYLYWNGSSWAIGYSTIRIGDRAGSITQGEAAIAIGAAAGYLNQGSTSIAIGKYAGYSNQSTNTIVINATGSFLNTMFPNSLYIAPIRNDPTHSNTFLQYNPVTAEVIYNSSQIISATQANIVNLTASTINSAQLYALLNNGTNTWVKNTAISGLYYTYSAAMSATGQYQSMATQQYLSFPYGIFRSADFGNTWTLASGTSTNWGYIAISATGQYQLAGTNSIYVSNDFGVSFSIKNAASVSAGVAVSQSGQYMSVTNSTRAVYTSSDYGNTWQYITSVPGVSGTSYISLSATGQYQTATVQGGNGRVIISSNYGSTWTLISYPSYAVFYSIGLSQTGQYQTTGSYGGTIYISSDYGNTWAATSAPNNIWTSVAVSQSGQYQTAVVSNGGIYTSTDYGYSWTITSAPSKTWNSIAISQDNQYQLASYIDPGNGGGLYYLNNNNSALYISPIRNDTTQSNIFLQYNISTNEVIYNANRIISMNQINTSSLTASTINTSVLTATQIVNLNASISSLTVSSINGLQGGLPAGSNYGDYLYYNGTRWVTGFSTISIGDKAGSITQGEAAVAIGAAAGQSNQYTGAVAIGQQAGQSTQKFWAVAVGYQAGQYSQANQTIAIGFQAGQYNQNGIAIGSLAGAVNQNSGIAIGSLAGEFNQSGIAIGNSAGFINQSTGSIAIGDNAAGGSVDAFDGQRQYAIAIGAYAGVTKQQADSIAIGAYAGYSNQSPSSIAIGYSAGNINQSTNSIAIGIAAGQSTQGAYSIAVGNLAGQTKQGSNTVAIGNNAGRTNQGSNAVAIGYAAGSNNQSTNTIVINASGVTLNTSTANAFYVAPIRSDNTQRLPLAYNTVTKEIVTTSGNQLITDFVLPASVTSPAFGQTWILNRSAPVGVNWYGVAVSGTGQYQLGLVNGGSLYKSTDFGNTWAAVAGVSGTLYSAAISGTGQYQTVVQYPGFIYGSSDFGNTWAITNANNKNWAGVSISYTGQYQTVCDNTPGYIWYSLDYGVTWTQSSSPISYWTYVACSATGLYQTATSSSGIFTSADYGVTWTLAYTGALYWWTVALSQTGRYQLVVVQGNNVGSGLGYVYTSKDYGSTWTQATIPQYQYLGCAMSATGQYQVVCSGTNPYTSQTTTNTIYISTDYGYSWTLVANMPPGVSWYNVAMSGTAEYMTICTTNGGIYNSSSPVATGLTTSNVALGYYAGQSTQGAYGIAIGNAAGQFIQGISSIAIGVNAGQSNQLGSAVAIGVNAGQSNQADAAIAIGLYAGVSTQGASGVAIGQQAGQNAQGAGTVAIGLVAGNTNQGTQATAVGWSAGQYSQGSYATGVGVAAGFDHQGQYAVSVGRNAGSGYQGNFAVAMGNQTGQFNQSTNAVAIGAFAGRNNQGSNAIAIGYAAGSNNQSTNTIVINATGVALNTTVSSSLYITPIRNDESVASGFLHYNSTTKEIVFNAQGGANGVKIYGSTIYVSSITTNTASISSLTVSSINGLQGGGNGPIIYASTIYVSSITTNTASISSLTVSSINGLQGGGTTLSTGTAYGDYLYWSGTGWAVGDKNVVIGGGAGQTNQGNYGIAIGYSAGNINQGSNSVSIGYNSGNVNQGIFATAVGYSAGNTQATGAVAVGASAGNSNQQAYAVAVGYQAGILNQSTNAVAIGVNAGYLNQGSNAIAIGNSAGRTSQLQNTIILNATGTALNSANSNSLYIAPIRNDESVTAGFLHYNAATNEIVYNAQGGSGGGGGGSLPSTAVNRGDYLYWNGASWVTGFSTISIGDLAGGDGAQANNAVAIGGAAGNYTQRSNAVAVGFAAGYSNQGAYAVAVGYNAGYLNQGSNAIAIGYAAGSNNQSTNTIVINATGVALNTAVSSSLYIDPIRNDESVTSGFLHYNSTTKEIVFNAQGGGGTLIYTSTLYASSVTTATASISSLVVSSINGPGSNGNFIYNVNGLLGATSSVNILPIFQTSTVVFAQNTGSFNYLPAPANFSTNNGGLWTSSLIFANYASNFLPFPYFSAGQNTPGYYSYYTNGGQINALFSFKPYAYLGGNLNSAAAVVGFSTSLGYYTVGDYELSVGLRSTILYTPSGSFVFGQPLPDNSTWQVQRTSNSLVFQYSSITNNFSTVYTVNNINVYDTAQLYMLNNNNYGTTYLGSWQVSALDQLQSFNVACAAQFSTLNATYGTVSSLTVSSIGSVSLAGDIDMKLNNIKNIGSSEYSVPPFTFSIAPTSTITSGSYTYFVCNSSCTVSLGANLTNVVYFSLGGGAGGGSGYYNGGGGGAGGLRTNDPAIFSSLTLSSLQYNNNFLTLTNGQIYTITIGTGGGTNTNGTNTTFISGVSTFVTATGGGTGGWDVSVGISGGCGGGGTRDYGAGGIGSQGFNGGLGGFSPTSVGGQGGGGGGITSIGVNGTVANQGGAGGAGLTFLGITCGYGGRGGAKAEYGGGATTGANATTPGSGGGGSADYITAGSGASGIFILGIPTAQIYNRRYGIISIDTNTNLVISTPTNIVLSGITGPNSNSPFVLTYNSTSGIVNYNTLPNTLVSTIAYGTAAGSIRQGDKAVAVGYYAGQSTQGANAIAIGNFAGLSYQSTNAVAIGAFAGQSSQGSNAVAIGYAAGSNNQSTNTIIINATGVALNSAISSSLYISPIRQNNSITTNALAYDTGTNEVVYNTTKTFVIDHPKDESKYLVHACLEGPEAGVYYRGTAAIADLETSVTITLPEYVDALATEFTVQVTPIYNGSVRTLNVSRISNNMFMVYGDSGEFDWHVYGRRLVVDVEPKKSSVNVLGTGPYRWIA